MTTAGRDAPRHFDLVEKVMEEKRRAYVIVDHGSERWPTVLSLAYVELFLTCPIVSAQNRSTSSPSEPLAL